MHCRWRGELARIDVDLQHGAVDRRTNPELLQIDAGERQIAARGNDLGFVRREQWRVDGAERNLAFGQLFLGAQQRSAGVGQRVRRRAGRTPLRRGAIHHRLRVEYRGLCVCGRVLGPAAIQRLSCDHLLVAQAPAHAGLRLRRRIARLDFIVVEQDQRLTGENRVVHLDQNLADNADRRRRNLDDA